MSEAIWVHRASALGIVCCLQGCGARTSLEGLEDDAGLAAGSPGAGVAGRAIAGASARGGFAQGGAAGTNGGSAFGGRANTVSTVGGQATGGGIASSPLSGGVSFGGSATSRSSAGGSTLGGRAAGGSGTGGSTLGGRAAGGSASGGRAAGGSASGGRAAGGSASGGRAAGGLPIGGNATGGIAQGGTAAGGVALGGAAGDPGGGLCPPNLYVPTGCIPETLEGLAGLCNDLDDDCDGIVDEGCSCTPGAVKACFAGPPSRRGVGACQDGRQDCVATPLGGGLWGPCQGGIEPTPESCDNLDNDCNGCRDEIPECVPVMFCPGPSDARVPEMKPFSSFDLDANQFYSGIAVAYQWSIEGGPCDLVAPTSVKSFDLENASSQVATFTPRLSGDYKVSLSITGSNGGVYGCQWLIPVRGPGLRIEMCYPESARLDLDLYLKRLSTPTPWFDTHDVQNPNLDACAWNNCEAAMRGEDMRPERYTLSRVDWGYAASPLSECVNGPQGTTWETVGYCANPRLDIDNNTLMAIGLPENINIDQPRDGDGFRIMVQNFSGELAHPIINVYCAGNRIATFGAPPDTVPDFAGIESSPTTIYDTWRVADVVVHGDSTSMKCEVNAIHPPGSATGYYVTYDDPSF